MNARPSRFVHAGGDNGMRVSFEFFPPKTAEMEATLWELVTRLAPLKPDFVSVTYGAGGSTRERTHATVKRILGETALTPAAHLTCVAATKPEIDEVIHGYHAAGVRHIVALRGDPIGGVGEKIRAAPGRLQERRRSCRGHQAARARHRRVGLGLSGEASGFADGRRRHRHAEGQGRRRREPRDDAVLLRERPVLPLSRPRARGRHQCADRAGILPVQNFKQTKNFAARTGASVPDWLAERFDGLDDDAATRKLIAAAVAAEQVLDLVDRGVTDFHFYTMNRADLVYAVCHLLGLRPAVPVVA